jgi:hypothetical protein
MVKIKRRLRLRVWKANSSDHIAVSRWVNLKPKCAERRGTVRGAVATWYVIFTKSLWLLVLYRWSYPIEIRYSYVYNNCNRCCGASVLPQLCAYGFISVSSNASWLGIFNVVDCEENKVKADSVVSPYSISNFNSSPHPNSCHCSVNSFNNSRPLSISSTRNSIIGN